MITAEPGNPEIHAAAGDAQCIEIVGADARAFAQAQFSGDVHTLQAGRWQWNAWLDHKGSVRALMHLACIEDDSGDERLLALLRGGDAQSLCAALQRYVLRARVSLKSLTGLRRAAGVAWPLGKITTTDDGIEFGYGDRSLWLKSNETPIEPAREHDLRLADIRAGWPTLPPGKDHGLLPPALGLEHLGAVSFDKGCYPGQEIAARLHYRGGHKLRLAHVHARFPLMAGQPISSELPRSTVLDAVPTSEGFEGLAVLDDSRDYSNLADQLKVVHRFDA